MRNHYGQVFLAAAEGAEIGHGSVQISQLQQAFNETDHLPEQKAKQHFQRQARLDRGIAERWLTPPFEGDSEGGGAASLCQTGPIFLCADRCERGGGDILPEVLGTAPDYLIKGYNAGGRMIYGTGEVVESEGLAARAEVIFANRHVPYIHVRSARDNCYQVRNDRGS